MADINALGKLDTQISKFKTCPMPPTKMELIDNYTKSIKQLGDDAAAGVEQVKAYIENIEEKLSELKNAQRQLIHNSRDALKKLLEYVAAQLSDTQGSSTKSKQVSDKTTRMNSFLPDIVNATGNKAKYTTGKSDNIASEENDSVLEKLKIAHALEKAMQNLLNGKLNELIQLTEKACEKAKKKRLTKEDANALLDCVNSWDEAKCEMNAAEKRRANEKKKTRNDEKLKQEENKNNKKKKEKEVRDDEEKMEKETENEKKEEDKMKKQSEEEERRRLEEEEQKVKQLQKRQAEEARRKRRKEEEEQKRKRKEEEEQRKREKKERIRLEREEKAMLEAEEKRKKAEEERKRKEDERKRMQDEAERQRILRQERLEEERKEKERLEKEAEEKAMREAEEKRRKAEEERKRKEDERKRMQEEAERQRILRQKRLEEERKEKERLKKEAEEKAWRRDPENWNSFVYNRSCDEVDDNRDYHKGIGCVLTSTPDSISMADIECCASDEVDSIIEVVDEHETPLSSVIEVQSRKEDLLKSEVPFRIYIPYNYVVNANEEIAIKSSVDRNNWKTTAPVHPTMTMKEDDSINNMIGRMVGLEVNDCSNVRLLVVARPKMQAIAVDCPGVSVYSSADRNVRLFVPRDAFPDRTEIQMMIQPTMSELYGYSSFKSVTRVGSLVTLLPQVPSNRPMEVDFIKNFVTKQDRGTQLRGKTCHVYQTGNTSWKLADVENKGLQGDSSVILPAGKGRYATMEMEVSAQFPKDDVLILAEEIQTSLNKTTVVMIVKQINVNPKDCTVRVVRKNEVINTLQALDEKRYTHGPDVSGEFKIKEGQYLRLSCSGNIELKETVDEAITLPYMSYRGGVKCDIKINVKDEWKQKDLPSYIGKISCHLLRNRSGKQTESFIEMTITLPKQPRVKTMVRWTKLHFPYYLTVLVNYLSCEMFKDVYFDWQAVLKYLMGSREYVSRCRIARRKFANDDDKNLCRVALLDWMKAKPISEDKVKPIIETLRTQGEVIMAENCEAIVVYMKDKLSDKVLKQLAQKSTNDVNSVGRDLDLDADVVEVCKDQHLGSVESQIEALLRHWRETDLVLHHGLHALDYLKTVI